ncbi:MAG: DUF1963 domain-containing protein [Oscillospiraceae bacterium]|nr:DUF1963 domain-containing protein [Oscillospiraceae bacterium]
MDIKKVLNQIYQQLPPQPALAFAVEAGDDDIFGNKLGGTPYFPKSMEYPLGKRGEFKGQPLLLLAQLNFERLPHIPDFPTTGILQFFIAGDDLYGMNCNTSEDQVEQDNFRVIYHAHIITDESQLLHARELPQAKVEETLLPFTGIYKLLPQEPRLMPPTLCDQRFEDIYEQLRQDSLKDGAGEEIPAFTDVEEDFDQLFEAHFPDAVIGGYPLFTQFDPRMGELEKLDTLLFELNSVLNRERGIDICWGDAGTGSFFIQREKLKALDFSCVLYNYDCY